MLEIYRVTDMLLSNDYPTDGGFLCQGKAYSTRNHTFGSTAKTSKIPVAQYTNLNRDTRDIKK